MGRQSATSDGQNGGRAFFALRPSSVSWMPRRRKYPAIRNITLAMKGIRQPQASTFAGVIDALTAHAVAEPMMNPIVVPAAVELLTRPRINGDDASVVYTIEPVNSPPSEIP